MIPPASTSPFGSLIAADGIIFMLAFLIGTYYAWRGLGALKWDTFMYDPTGENIRILRFFLALLGGFLVGAVAVGYLLAGQSLRVLWA
ncbi:DUF1146 domain-containing protein [Alicyclobacillaceae bacterium I2511]|nr:DUF1146 domain-containing protein [Alicyclobacillaceae bacterium I2511]